MNYPKGECRTLRSLNAKVDAQFKKEKSDLLKTMAAADMVWAWGSKGRKK